MKIMIHCWLSDSELFLTPNRVQTCWHSPPIICHAIFSVIHGDKTDNDHVKSTNKHKTGVNAKCVPAYR